MTDEENIYKKWFSKIDVEKRVKAVCKPCWEIKYCPYGPVVEDFPLADEADDRRCRIFGHICPVFLVAEPFTETHELRRVSRSITRVAQFRVLRRDQSRCRKCGVNLTDEDVRFDHVIPWSKGGSSDESNIQVLCEKCNREKSDNLPENFLIKSAFQHVVGPIGVQELEFQLEVARFAHAFFSNEGEFPNAEDFARCLSEGEKGLPEARGAQLICEWREFFEAERPQDISSTQFSALKYRWGFEDEEIHSLKDSASKFGIDLEELLNCELDFVRRFEPRLFIQNKDKTRWRQL